MHILQEWLINEVKRGGHWAKLPKQYRKRFKYRGPVYCGEREEDLPMPDRMASEYTANELVKEFESRYVDFPVNRETAREFWWDEVGFLLFLCCETIKMTKYTPMDNQQEHYGNISGPNLESNCQQKWRRLVSNVDKMMRLRAGLKDFDQIYGITNEIKSRTFALGKSYPTMESSACTVTEATFKLAKELSRLVHSCCLENSFRSLLNLSIRLANKPHNMAKAWAASLENESMFVDGLLPAPEPDSIPIAGATKKSRCDLGDEELERRAVEKLREIPPIRNGKLSKAWTANELGKAIGCSGSKAALLKAWGNRSQYTRKPPAKHAKESLLTTEVVAKVRPDHQQCDPADEIEFREEMARMNDPNQREQLLAELAEQGRRLDEQDARRQARAKKLRKSH